MSVPNCHPKVQPLLHAFTKMHENPWAYVSCPDVQKGLEEVSHFGLSGQLWRFTHIIHSCNLNILMMKNVTLCEHLTKVVSVALIFNVSLGNRKLLSLQCTFTSNLDIFSVRHDMYMNIVM